MRQTKNIEHVHFAERLRQAIEKSGLGKAVIAQRVGVAPPAISRWLREALPEAKHLANLARTLNVTVQWLLSGETDDAGALLTGPDGSRYYVPPRQVSPPENMLQEQPAPYDESPVEKRLRIMMERVQQDANAMIHATPSRRAQLAEMARSHITHFLAWLESSDLPDAEPGDD